MTKKASRVSRRTFVGLVTGAVAGGMVAGTAKAQSGNSDSDANDRAGNGRSGISDADDSDRAGYGRGRGTGR